MLLKNLLSEKRNEYINLLRKIRPVMIEGSLVIHKSKGVKYYHSKYINKIQKIKYLKKKDLPIARKLAQNSYNKKVESLLNKRINQFDEILENFDDFEVEDVFNRLGDIRKELVIPLDETSMQRLERWISEPFISNPRDFPEDALVTRNGEKVRSKSEKILADLFYELGIPYKYEKLVVIGGREFYPDFTFFDPISGKEIYWEHFGMMNNPEYTVNTVEKIKWFEKNGISRKSNFITTFEHGVGTLDMTWVNLQIKEYLGFWVDK